MLLHVTLHVETSGLRYTTDIVYLKRCIFQPCRKQILLLGHCKEVTYINKWRTPSLNASGSIISIGLSDNILEQ